MDAKDIATLKFTVDPKALHKIISSGRLLEFPWPGISTALAISLRVSCPFPFLAETQKQFLFGLFHAPRGLGIALRTGQLIHGLDAEYRLQIAFSVG